MQTAELPTPINWPQVLDAAWTAYDAAKKRTEQYNIDEFVAHANKATAQTIGNYWREWVENCWWLLAEGYCLIVDNKFALVRPYNPQEICRNIDGNDDPEITPDGREIYIPVMEPEGPPLALADEAMADSLIAHLPEGTTDEQRQIAKRQGWYVSLYIHGGPWLGEWWKLMMMDLPTVCPEPIAPTPAELKEFFRKNSMSPAAKAGQAALF